jgi:opacity protein-like surface antigen
MMKILRITSASLIITAAACSSLTAGSIGFGFNLGLTYDQNGLEPEISRLNTRLIKYEAANTGTDMTRLNIPYSPVIGVNMRYSHNNLIIRTGLHYARTFIYAPSGNIAPPASPDNRIRFDSYAATVPLNLMLSIQPFSGASIYAGPGAGATISKIMITQSAPNGFLSPDEPSLTYEGKNISWNWITGIEVPVGERAAFTAEWIWQSALSGSSESTETGHRRPVNSSCSIILFGYNYYLRID